MGSRGRWIRAATKAKKSRSPMVRTASGQLLKDLHEGLDLSRWEPELCVQMLRIPSVNNYSAIAKLLAKANKPRQDSASQVATE
ncbi:hypothetical protein L798_03275 [Zootermopsis nevadensis]|uniref:Uncharacterized protein n=1 Tax=Zootermopsis nevadensis TaxID=136037 RepID=A0A067QIR0_ZOONE|nr:hypothetical protein L798_03275 [Zootermopsis nevadensis]